MGRGPKIGGRTLILVNEVKGRDRMGQGGQGRTGGDNVGQGVTFCFSDEIQNYWTLLLSPK